MKYLRSYEQMLSELALPLKIAKKYTKYFNRERYEELFKKLGEKYDHDRNFYRIYIPITEKGGSSILQTVIELYLKTLDAEIVDYVKGQCKYSAAKNPTKIGTVLNRKKDEVFSVPNVDNIFNNFYDYLTNLKYEEKMLYGNQIKVEDLMKLFVEDVNRKAGTDLIAVISRHPVDIAGADTDRDWSNCMTIGLKKSPRLTKYREEIKKLRK